MEYFLLICLIKTLHCLFSLQNSFSMNALRYCTSLLFLRKKFIGYLIIKVVKVNAGRQLNNGKQSSKTFVDGIYFCENLCHSFIGFAHSVLVLSFCSVVTEGI